MIADINNDGIERLLLECEGTCFNSTYNGKFCKYTPLYYFIDCGYIDQTTYTCMKRPWDLLSADVELIGERTYETEID
jgi:hypothetical protein